MEISILIVDDDKLLVDKIEETIDWKQLGITMVFTANNIRQAQKILEEYQVNILLSDIEMPQGSGLELLEWVRTRDIPIECIFLSGFAHFSYAQKALQLKSAEYLLKPVSNRDLTNVLQTVTDKLKEEHMGEETFSRGKEKFWHSYLEKEAAPEKLFERYGKKYRQEDSFILGLLKLIPDENHRNKKDLSLNHFIIQNTTAECFDERKVPVEALVHYSDFTWILVLACPDGTENRTHMMQEWRESLQRKFVIPVCLYISEPDHLANVSFHKKRLMEMENVAVPDCSGVLEEEEWFRRNQEEFLVSWSDWERAMMLSENLECVGEQIANQLEQYAKRSQLTRKRLMRFRFELIQFLSHYLEGKGRRFSDMFEDSELQSKYENAGFSMIGMKELITYLFRVLEGSRLQEKEKDSVITVLIHYINQNLSEELTRTKLAAKVFLSEDYLSRLFKTETGMSIPEYITKVRIEKAKLYLQSSSLPISKVAMEVGYNNFSYFSKNFRDIVGCTPNEYRNACRKNT